MCITAALQLFQIIPACLGCTAEFYLVGKLFQIAGKSPLGNRKRGGKLAGIVTFVRFYVAEHFIYSATYTAIYSANRLTLVDFQQSSKSPCSKL